MLTSRDRRGKYPLPAVLHTHLADLCFGFRHRECYLGSATPNTMVIMHPSLETVRKRFCRVIESLVVSGSDSIPDCFKGILARITFFDRASESGVRQDRSAGVAPAGPLRAYFDSHVEGNGIYKWNHYFEIYERHLAKFINREVKLCEIGVYSGGSLGCGGTFSGQVAVYTASTSSLHVRHTRTNTSGYS